MTAMQSLKRLVIALAIIAITLIVAIEFEADPRVLLLLTLLLMLALPATLVAAIQASLTRIRGLSSWKRRLPLAVVLAAVVIAASLHLYNGWLDGAIADRMGTRGEPAVDCHRIWSTRGSIHGADVDDSTAGNSIPALSEALELGAAGIEVDMFYDVDFGKFVISHNRPYDLKDGKLLFLEDAIGLFADSGAYIWVDLKKLRHLGKANARDAARRLATIARQHRMPLSHVFVEGADPVNLSAFRNAGLNTIFDTYPLPQDHLLAGFAATLYKSIFHFGEFTVMSLNYDLDGKVIFGKKMQEKLRPVPLFVYHVPTERDLMLQLSALDNVKVLLPSDHNSNLFLLDTCTATTP